MALVKGTNCGFVTTAPTSDPAASGIFANGVSFGLKDTSPAGNNVITEIGWWCGNGSTEANFEVGIYDHNSGDNNPENLLAGVSRTNAKGTDAGWKVVTGLNIPISASTIYWLSWQLDNVSTTATDQTDDAGEKFDSKSGTSTLTDPWGTTDNTFGKLLSIYAKVEAVVTEITTWAELAAISSGLSGDYVLMNNLDSGDAGYDTYASSSANGGLGWDPLGDVTTKFTGTFNGGGFTISDVYINRPSTNHVGFFGEIDGATIYDLGIVDCDITGSDYVGGFVGYDDSTGSSIANCFTTGVVAAAYVAGGFMGGIRSNSDMTISNCYSHTSAASADDYAGGFIGSFHAFSIGGVSNCYSTKSVSVVANFVGGFTSTSFGNFDDNFYDSTTSGHSDSNGSTPKTTIEMQTESTFTNWNFGTIWEIGSGEYPVLQVFDLLIPANSIQGVNSVTGVQSITI